MASCNFAIFIPRKSTYCRVFLVRFAIKNHFYPNILAQITADLSGIVEISCRYLVYSCACPEEKKAKLITEEAKFKLQERKMRIKYLIEIGGLITKAGLNILSDKQLLGAFLFLKETISNDETILQKWQEAGAAILEKPLAEKFAVAVKFHEEPATQIRSAVRSHGLKWNNLRKEWQGYVQDLDSLKSSIEAVKHDMEVIE